jgi:hypothetical protein
MIEKKNKCRRVEKKINTGEYYIMTRSDASHQYAVMLTYSIAFTPVYCYVDV